VLETKKPSIAGRLKKQMRSIAARLGALVETPS
jgi:hypothetical protein